jgi:hypothetical protein
MFPNCLSTQTAPLSLPIAEGIVISNLNLKSFGSGTLGANIHTYMWDDASKMSVE